MQLINFFLILKSPLVVTNLWKYWWSVNGLISHICHQRHHRFLTPFINRRPDGSLMPLPRKHIDTGMGLERLTALLNNSTSNYDTDLFQGLFSHIQKSCNSVPYGQCLTDPIDKAYRIVADHSRMFTVTIGDGLLPGRKESEWVWNLLL